MILDKPVCKANQKSMYGAARNEDIDVKCEVDSNPEPETFKWSFNHSQEPIPEKRFDRKHGGISILTFTPRTELDFGFLTCTATNRVGTQSEPCQYKIIPAGNIIWFSFFSPFFCSVNLEMSNRSSTLGSNYRVSLVTH